MLSSVLSSFGLGSPSKKDESGKAEIAEPEVATPGSTCAGSSPLEGTPQKSEYKADPSALPDYDYPAPVYVKNTFIDGPAVTPASLMEFMPPREAKSLPTSAFGAPPGLLSSAIAEESLEAALKANQAKADKSAAADASATEAPVPSGVSQPVSWPRTMSGDGLAQLAGVDPEQTASSGAPCAPAHWPKTGEDLDDLAAAADAVTPDRSSAASRALLSPSQDLGATPSPSPIRPSMWLNGDALESSLNAAAGAGATFSQASCDGGYAASQSHGYSQQAAYGMMPPPQCAPPQCVPVIQDGSLPEDNSMPPTWVPQVAPQVAPQTFSLRLSEAIPEPVLGSPEFPTQGSRFHGAQSCKPCAFLHTKGCQNGINCVFCHLCEPGEKKKRQRDKRQLQRAGVMW